MLTVVTNSSFLCDYLNTHDPATSNNDTFVKIHMDFTRNNFSFWAITFPILFIFFLLGSICFLEPKEHYLVARIAITLSVFAFVFTFDTVLAIVKPSSIQFVSTFADFLLKLVLFAAIASTISSAIGYRLVTMNNKKWKRRIRMYSIYDLIALISAIVIIIPEFNSYHIEFWEQFIYSSMVIIGLGWGLFSLIIYQRLLRPFFRKRERARIREQVSKVVNNLESSPLSHSLSYHNQIGSEEEYLNDKRS